MSRFTCSEQERLSRDYSRLLRIWSNTVQHALTTDEGPEGSYVDAVSRAEEVRVACERARAALEKHRAEHGC